MFAASLLARRTIQRVAASLASMLATTVAANSVLSLATRAEIKSGTLAGSAAEMASSMRNYPVIVRSG